MRKKKIFWFEPIFFLFFGVMHISRIWGLFNRQAYADAWLGLMYDKGAGYYFLMAVMALLCIIGIITFISQKEDNYWWRQIYIWGGGYILFDLSAIAARFSFWEKGLLMMFNINNRFWNAIWIPFILIGFFCFIWGIGLCIKITKQKQRL